MAGSISHTVYAKKALQTFLKGKDERQFIVGNLFPDIRYLKVIERDLTHFRNVSLEDVRQQPDSFKAGMLFHSLIDEAREAFVVSHDAYKGLPDSHLSTVALKICEDMELYSKIQDWQVYIDCLNTLIPEEQKFNIPVEKLREWHTMHRELFAHPVINENSKFLSSLGFTRKQVREIFTLVETITKNRTTDSYLSHFYDDLEHILLIKRSVATKNVDR